MKAWVLEGLDDGFVIGSPRLLESSGTTSKTISYSFSISNAMCFWSTKKGEVVNVVEMLIDKCLELWESSRFDPYSNESLLHVSEMGVETW